MTQSTDDRATDDRTLAALAAQVGAGLRASGWRVTAAESCTGGWIAKAITDVAGSSEWFDVGYVTYADAAKTDLLGVPAATLADEGAVSEAVVAAMAEGALQRSAADFAVAISGIAGPGGGTERKPVGTVWFAWASRKGRQCDLNVQVHHFAGNRDEIRRQAVGFALQGLLAQIRSAGV